MIEQRPLHLKLRVVVERRMTRREVMQLVDRAIETGVVPPGIEIAWLDWSKAGRVTRSGRILTNSDRISDPALDQLRAWRGAFLSPQGKLRIGIVRDQSHTPRRPGRKIRVGRRRD